MLSTNGDTHLGGDDIDNLLQAFVHEQILQHDEIDFSPCGEVAQELRKELIVLKHRLSERDLPSSASRCRTGRPSNMNSRAACWKL